MKLRFAFASAELDCWVRAFSSEGVEVVWDIGGCVPLDGAMVWVGGADCRVIGVMELTVSCWTA